MATKRAKIAERHFQDISEECNNTQRNNVVQGPSNRLKLRIDDLKTIRPLTENQKLFFDSYSLGEYFMMLSGSAGTGKTFIGLYKALEEVMDKGNSFTQVLIVRSAVQTREIGYLKGSLEEKGSIYEDPYISICAELFGKKDAYQRLTEQSYIDFVTTTALRGCTFNNTVVIADEVQNYSFQELDTILTRIGNQSKIIFIGDLSQNDLIKKSNDVTGMPQFMNIANTMNEFCRIHFTSSDIVRSSLVKSYIIAKEKMGL